MAGVEVGEISAVRLEDGKAIVTLRIDDGAVPVYQDASVLLRPKTGLKDMVAELTPGSAEAGELEEGQRIPIGQTLPDVNLDEILASLDGDTRTYLQLLLSDGGEALGGNGRALANTIRRFEPTARDTRRVAEQLAERRENIKRVIHNFSLLVEELGAKDDQLATFVDSSNAVFAALAAQDANLRATLRELPSTLDATQSALGKTRTSPTCSARRSRTCGPAPARSARRSSRRARSCARRRRSSATRSARSCAPRGRRCSSCARRRATSPPSRPTSCARSRSSTSCSTRSPTTRRARPRRASSSGRRGSTTSARRCSRTRTRRGRSGAASS